MTAASKAALLARRLGEGEYEIEGVGTVRIRGLSRAEVLELRKLDDVAEFDRQLVSTALVEPALTVDEVKTWQENSGPLEIERLVDAIRELSGLNEGAAKSGVPSVRE